MDDLPERISTADLLLAVPVALFGQKTVCVKMWRGRGNTDLNVPAGYYFATGRLGKHSDAPVNRLCAERVMDMAAIALCGESGYDRSRPRGKSDACCMNCSGLPRGSS